VFEKKSRRYTRGGEFEEDKFVVGKVKIEAS
jgi:hypothetical protein